MLGCFLISLRVKGRRVIISEPFSIMSISFLKFSAQNIVRHQHYISLLPKSELCTQSISIFKSQTENLSKCNSVKHICYKNFQIFQYKAHGITSEAEQTGCIFNFYGYLMAMAFDMEWMEIGIKRKQIVDTFAVAQEANQIEMNFLSLSFLLSNLNLLDVKWVFYFGTIWFRNVVVLSVCLCFMFRLHATYTTLILCVWTGFRIGIVLRKSLLSYMYVVIKIFRLI